MRKIIPRHKEAKRKRRKQIIVGIVLIFIMLVSIFGYSFGNTANRKEEVVYNGIKFVKEEGIWKANFKDLYLLLMNNPSQIFNIDYNLNLVNNYYGKPLYIYSEDSNSEIEIYRNLFYYNQIVQRMQPACFDGQECSEDLPMKTCEDNFIIIKEDEKNEVIQEDNCIFISGNKEELSGLTDGFLLKIIGLTQ